jgi:hypothetical protein
MLLDRPLMDYYLRIATNKPQQVAFLCSPNPGAHLVKNLGEMGITYTFLSIPVKEWDSWKKRADYEGD